MIYRGPYPITEPTDTGSLRQWPSANDPRGPTFGSNLIRGGRPAPYRMRIDIVYDGAEVLYPLHNLSFVADDLTQGPDGPVTYHVPDDPLIQSICIIRWSDIVIYEIVPTEIYIAVTFEVNGDEMTWVNRQPYSLLVQPWYVLNTTQILSLPAGGPYGAMNIKSIPWNAPDILED